MKKWNNKEKELEVKEEIWKMKVGKKIHYLNSDETVAQVHLKDII